MEPKNEVIWNARCKVRAKCISIYFSKSWFRLVNIEEHEQYFRGGFAYDYVWPSEGMGGNAGTPLPAQKKKSENFVFRGLGLSLGHFGQQVTESPVSQLQNDASTSSLPFLLIFEVYQRSNSFFLCKFHRVLNGRFHKRITMGRNSSAMY